MFREFIQVAYKKLLENQEIPQKYRTLIMNHIYTYIMQNLYPLYFFDIKLVEFFQNYHQWKIFILIKQ